MSTSGHPKNWGRPALVSCCITESANETDKTKKEDTGSTYSPVTLVLFFTIAFLTTCWTYGIGFIRLSVCLSLSLSLSLSVLCVSLCLSLSLFLCVSLCLCVSLSASHSLYLCVPLSVSHFLCLSLSLFPLSVSLFVSVSLSPSLSHYVSLFFSIYPKYPSIISLFLFLAFLLFYYCSVVSFIMTINL